MSFKIKDVDHGYKEFQALIGVLRKNRASVVVGITEAEGGKQHSEHASMSEIATIHEFGLGVPERSWLRGWFDENKEWIREEIKKATKAVLEGRITEDQALELLGQKFVGSIKERISGNAAGFKELSPITIARKGSTVPLVDEGRFIGSISHEVRPRGSNA